MTIQFTSKKEIVEKLRKQIANKDVTAIHTLLFIYDKQAEDEKNSESVNHNNGVGFKPHDAKMGSSLAKWYKSNGFFTPKQMNTVKQMVAKYAGQIVEAKICEGEIRKIKRGEWIWG